MSPASKESDLISLPPELWQGVRDRLRERTDGPFSAEFCRHLLDEALRYAALGLAVFPCRAAFEPAKGSGEPKKPKAPLTRHGVNNATTDPGRIRHWWGKEFPGAMIGVALGERSGGWVVIDVDAKPGGKLGVNTLGAMAQAGYEWPQTGGCVTTPTAGMHLWFKATGECPPTSKLDGIDLLSNGRYVIAPPSRIIGEPATYDFVAYPGGPHATLADFLGDNEPPEPPEWMYRPDEVRAILGGEPSPPARAIETDDSDPFHKFSDNLNEDALANLDAWVPKLGLYRLRAAGGRYEAVATWRPSSKGRADELRERNLKIHHTGIRDFGGIGYSPIKLVMAARDLDFNKACIWLGEALGWDFSPKIVLKAKAASESAPEEGHDDEADAEAEITPKREDLEALCQNIPGLVGDILDWIVGCARQPSRPIALGPALTFVGTLAGRLHAGPTELRTNLYVVALAQSGFGKDHPRKAIDRLAVAAGLDRFMGPARVKSDSGLRRAIEHKPSQLMMIDEFGGFVRQIMDRRASQHNAQIRQDLLDYYTSSGGVFRGAAYADLQPEPIFNPCLSIYGTSTPADFWTGMSAQGLSDGFLPRCLVLNVEGDPADEVEPAGARAPPRALVEACQAVVSLSVSSKLPPGYNQVVSAREAVWGDAAKAVYERHKRDCRDRGKSRRGETDVLWTRAMEQALKVAHIVAIGVDPREPVLTADMVEWGAQLAILSTLTTIGEVRDRLASNDRQAEYLEVKRIVKAAGQKGITRREVGRALNGKLDTDRRDKVIAQLIGDGAISEREHRPAHGGRPTAKLFGR